MKVLDDYNKFINKLPKGFKVDLDHPLSKAFLKSFTLLFLDVFFIR